MTTTNRVPIELARRIVNAYSTGRNANWGEDMQCALYAHWDELAALVHPAPCVVLPEVSDRGRVMPTPSGTPTRFGVNAARYEGMWETRCDGMPTPMGCNQTVAHSRPYSRFGRA